MQAEFGQAKMAVIEHYRKLLHDKEMAHQVEVTKLQVTQLIQQTKSLSPLGHITINHKKLQSL